MIAVEKVIRKLVGEYEFVIIPGFGALLSHQIHASYDLKSGFFSPPAKKLAFNEYLKLDDGLLANYISRHQKWSHLESVEYVKRYTETLRSGLESNGRASIAGIGEFSMNGEGKLVFEPHSDKCFKDEWYGFEKVKALQIHNGSVSAPLTKTYVTEESVEVVELGDEEQVRSFRWVGWAAAAVFIGLLCGLSVFFVNSSESEIRSTLNPFTELFVSKAEIKEKTSKVIAEPVKEDPAAPAEVPVVKIDSLAVDSSAVIKPTIEIAPEPVKAVVATPAPLTAKFYVIAGAFKGKKQAKVLLAELNKKGFENAILLPADKYSTKVKVAVSGHDNETDAYRASAKLKQVIGEAGWVFKKR